MTCNLLPQSSASVSSLKEFVEALGNQRAAPRQDALGAQDLKADRTRNIYSYMKRDSRLSGVLHVLLHMAEHPHPMTSEMLARAMGTNPVVIRRLMAGLRERGFVRSEKGHGGGWTIACDLAAVSLRDVYEALGRPSLLAMGNRTEASGCLVEQAVNAALGDAFDEAESLLLRRFGTLTLATLSADFHKRLARRGGSTDLEKNHAA
jgi:DNA-binding IscR family transcriptional regulator